MTNQSPRPRAIWGILLCSLLHLAINNLYGQPDVYVDKATGALRVYVPVYALSAGDLSAGISLSYVHGSGVPLNTPDGDTGLGWHLDAGGSVSRELRGLPDDFSEQPPGERKGWLTPDGGQLVAAKVGGLSLTSGESSNRTALQQLLNTEGKLIYDTEPDLFHVSAPGLNCQFIFDQTGMPRPLPHNDVQIEAHRSSTGNISSFTITDASGTKYYFTGKATSTRSTSKASLPVAFHKTTYNYYTTPVTYTKNWTLTRITSYYGHTLYFNYAAATPQHTEESVSVWMRDTGSSENYVEKKAYTLEEDYTPLRLTTIYTAKEERAEFTYEGDQLKYIEISDRRRTDNPYVKTIEFQYQSVTSTVDGSRRRILEGLREYSGCDRLPAYEFTYHDVASMPGPGSGRVDYWGYYNNRAGNSTLPPKLVIYPNEAPAERIQLYRGIETPGKSSYVLDGSDRRPDKNYTSFGILQQVKMPLGDEIRVTYESNTYYDAFYGQTVPGPGVRVKYLSRSDKRTATVKSAETITYHYTTSTEDLTNGPASGHLLNAPRFAFMLQGYQHNGTTYSYQDLTSGSFTDRQKWEYLTARSTENLGQTDQQVIYSSMIKKTASESGFTQTLSTLPPGENQQAAIWEDWQATAVKWARHSGSGCTVSSDISTGINTYPYIPHSTSGAESILFGREIIYDGTGRKLVEKENHYQRQARGTSTVRGIYIEEVPFSCASGEYLIGTYNLTCNVFYPLHQTISTNLEYDGTVQHATQTEQTYHRNSTKHPYVTTTVRTLADGSKLRTENIYPEDYTLSGTPAGTAGNALENLVLSHRVGTPVETVSSQQLPGQTTYQYTGASYTSYKNVNGKIVSHQAHVFDPGFPVSDFEYSNATAGTLSPDTRYETILEVTVDDKYRKTGSYSPRTRTYQATLWGNVNNVPVLEATNIHTGELFYTDFSNHYSEDNIQTSTSELTNVFDKGRNDAYSINIAAKGGASVAGKIDRVKNDYFISFWSNNTAAENVKVEFFNTEGGAVQQTVNFSLPAGSHWQYHRKKIDLSGLGSTVYFTFSRGIAAGIGTELTVDDILIYPSEAAISTRAYTFPFGASSTTSGNGQSGRTEYDGLGRVTGVYDEEDNLLQAYKYQYADLPEEPFERLSLSHGTVYEGVETAFQTRQFCRDNVTYQWAFMDIGVTPQASDYISGDYQVKHTFTTDGEKTVHIRASHPDFAAITYSQNLTVVKKPLNISACSKGQLSYDLCQEYESLVIDCADITETPSNDLEALMKVTSVQNGDGNYTYQWQKRIAGGVQWTNLPETTPLIRICTQEDGDYKCIVTDGTGQKGESQLFTIKRYRTFPDCQIQVPSCN